MHLGMARAGRGRGAVAIDLPTRSAIYKAPCDPSCFIVGASFPTRETCSRALSPGPGCARHALRLQPGDSLLNSTA